MVNHGCGWGGQAKQGDGRLSKSAVRRYGAFVRGLVEVGEAEVQYAAVRAYNACRPRGRACKSQKRPTPRATGNRRPNPSTALARLRSCQRYEKAGGPNSTRTPTATRRTGGGSQSAIVLSVLCLRHSSHLPGFRTALIQSHGTECTMELERPEHHRTPSNAAILSRDLNTTLNIECSQPMVRL